MTDTEMTKPTWRRFIFRKPEDKYAPDALIAAKAFADAAFKLASWCMLLGVLKYLGDKSGSAYLHVGFVVLNAALLALIYWSVNAKVGLNVIPIAKRTTRARKLMDFGVNVVVSCAVYWACLSGIGKLVEAISSLQGLK